MNAAQVNTAQVSRLHPEPETIESEKVEVSPEGETGGEPLVIKGGGTLPPAPVLKVESTPVPELGRIISDALLKDAEEFASQLKTLMGEVEDEFNDLSDAVEVVIKERFDTTASITARIHNFTRMMRDSKFTARQMHENVREVAARS